MSDKTYEKVRVVGCSQESVERAIEVAVAKVAQARPGASWFEVVEIRGALSGGKVSEWQATVDVAARAD